MNPDMALFRENDANPFLGVGSDSLDEASFEDFHVVALPELATKLGGAQGTRADIDAIPRENAYFNFIILGGKKPGEGKHGSHGAKDPIHGKKNGMDWDGIQP